MAAGWATDKESRSGIAWPQEMRVSDQLMASQESADGRNLAVVSQVQYNYVIALSRSIWPEPQTDPGDR